MATDVAIDLNSPSDNIVEYLTDTTKTDMPSILKSFLCFPTQLIGQGLGLEYAVIVSS